MNSTLGPETDRALSVSRRAVEVLQREYPGSRWVIQPDASEARKARVIRFSAHDNSRQAALRLYASPIAASRQAAGLQYGAAMNSVQGHGEPRVYAWFEDASALLMEWRQAPHLETVLMRAALAPMRHRDSVRRVGEWLRHFHALDRIEDAALEAQRYRVLLRRRLAAAPAGAAVLAMDPLWREATAWLEQQLQLLDGHSVPFARTHGDFTFTNVLVEPSRITGIDIWAEQRLPAAEDLARMFVYLAMGDVFPLRARVVPVALPVRRAQQALFEGYGSRVDPRGRTWQLLVCFEALARYLALQDRLVRRNSFSERWKVAGLRGLLTGIVAGV